MIPLIKDIITRGHAALRRAPRVSGGALDSHRIGSAGCIGTDGAIYGTCPRKALLRQEGLELPVPLYTDLLWKWGEANEHHWSRLFAGGLPLEVTVAPEVVIKRTVPGCELPVEGHPDAVLLHKGEPVMGVELKGCFGHSTAAALTFDNMPKNANVIQTAAYSRHLDCLPFALVYTSGAYVKTSDWEKNRYGMSSIKPFYKTFYLEWKGAALVYREEDDGVEVSTVVTQDGIDQFYQLIEEMREKRDLGPRPSSHYISGKKNRWGPQSDCGLCEFRDVCDAHESDYPAWKRAATALTKGEAK